MHIRFGAHHPGSAPRLLKLPSLALLSFIFLGSLLLFGCAAPGEPTERRPPIPVPVRDLAAQQSGNSIVLTFKLPKETIQRLPLKSPPAVEIYRQFIAVTANPSSKPAPSLIFTIPPSLVSQYVTAGSVRFVDQLTAADFSLHPASQVVYMVRTRASEKKASDDSNLAVVRVHAAFDAISDLRAQVTHPAIVLSWTPPQKALDGSSPSLAGYHIYRSEAAAPNSPGQSSDVASSTVAAPALKSPLSRIAVLDPAATSFRDTDFAFGVVYVYSVRSLAHFPDGDLESADSNLVLVTPKDIFPPSAPQGLEVVFVPALPGSPAHLELSWAINPETDIAGYNVYRSEQESVAGARLNTALLPTPSFRDMNAQPGRRYFYSVAAVDRAGNESPLSGVVSGGVPAESQ